MPLPVAVLIVVAVVLVAASIVASRRGWTFELRASWRRHRDDED